MPATCAVRWAKRAAPASRAICGVPMVQPVSALNSVMSACVWPEPTPIVCSQGFPGEVFDKASIAPLGRLRRQADRAVGVKIDQHGWMEGRGRQKGRETPEDIRPIASLLERADETDELGVASGDREMVGPEAPTARRMNWRGGVATARGDFLGEAFAGFFLDLLPDFLLCFGGNLDARGASGRGMPSRLRARLEDALLKEGRRPASMQPGPDRDLGSRADRSRPPRFRPGGRPCRNGLRDTP